MKTASAFVAHVLVGLGELRQVGGQPLGGHGAGTGLARRRPRSSRSAPSLERLDVLRVGRRRQAFAGIEGRPRTSSRASAMTGELLLLVDRARSSRASRTRETSGTFDRRAAIAVGVGERRRQHLDGVGIGRRDRG